MGIGLPYNKYRCPNGHTFRVAGAWELFVFQDVDGIRASAGSSCPLCALDLVSRYVPLAILVAEEVDQAE